ncbi:MAG: winged helix-turn-helix domain-containing protein [Pseudomonadales bacterium]
MPAEAVYRIGTWTIEPQRNRLSCDDEVRTLPPKAMDVLVCLLERSGTVVSIAELIRIAWKGRPVEESSVHQRISQIRHVLGNPPSDEGCIENIPRRGYRLTGLVERLPPANPPESGQRSVARQQIIAIPNLRNLTPAAELGWLAEGLTEHLRRQVARWPRFDVIPGALLRGAELPAGADLLVDGFLQVSGKQTIVALDLIDLATRQRRWSQRFHGEHEDPYELQQQMSAAIARVLGESLLPRAVPANPAAYPAFLRMLSIHSYGSYDTHHRLLTEVLEQDPEWYWGWADLASLLLRMATIDRDQHRIDEARAILESKGQGNGRGYARLVRSLLAVYWDGDLDLGEDIARSLAERGTGWPYSLLLMVSGLYREAESYFHYLTRAAPYDSVGWEMLTESRLLLGNATGAVAAARTLVTLYPPDAVNALLLLIWPLVFADELEEATALMRRADELLKTLGSGTQQRMCQKSLEQSRFELAMRSGDRARATEAAEQIHGLGDAVLAGVLALRLGDSRATGWLAEPLSPQFQRFWWWKARALMTGAIAEHPSILAVEAALGFTPQWRLELARRAATLPADSHICCDPALYET